MQKKVSWQRPEFLSAPASSAGSTLVASARARSSRPWVLFVGDDDSALQAAASEWMFPNEGFPRIAPSAELPLSIAAHLLAPPGLSGERILYLERLDLGFFDTLSHGGFSASSPLYLLPLLATVASEGEPLGVVATASAALEVSAPSVLAQRGLASRFEIRKLAEGPAAAESRPAAEDGIEDQIAGAATAERCLALGLATRDPELRAGAYERALAIEPSSGLAHLFAASSRLEGGRADEAGEALVRAAELEPGLAAAYYELGKLAIQSDDMEGALAAFRKTTELLPEYPSAWGNLGAALGEVQRLDEAAEALTHAVTLDPLNPALRSNLGVSLRDQGRLEEAETCLRDALSLSPDFVFGHYNLASILYLMGRYPEAIERFEQARSLDRSGSPRQSLLLAIARLASGDERGALREYRNVFDRLDGRIRTDMRTVAEWDLKQLAEREGVTSPLREAAALLRSLA